MNAYYINATLHNDYFESKMNLSNQKQLCSEAGSLPILKEFSNNLMPDVRTPDKNSLGFLASKTLKKGLIWNYEQTRKCRKSIIHRNTIDTHTPHKPSHPLSSQIHVRNHALSTLRSRSFHQ